MSAEDFFSSAVRHLEDALTLHSRGRIDEAAYLAGYVIECALKKLLQVRGGSNARGYGHDLRGMTSQALTLAAVLAPAANRYRVDGIASLPAAMAYWRPELRYWTTGDVKVADAELLINVAKEVARVVLVQLVLDGNEGSVR